jgi:hypothetical protein
VAEGGQESNVRLLVFVRCSGMKEVKERASGIDSLPFPFFVLHRLTDESPRRNLSSSAIGSGSNVNDLSTRSGACKECATKEDRK